MKLLPRFSQPKHLRTAVAPGVGAVEFLVLFTCTASLRVIHFIIIIVDVIVFIIIISSFNCCAPEVTGLPVCLAGWHACLNGGTNKTVGSILLFPFIYSFFFFSNSAKYCKLPIMRFWAYMSIAYKFRFLFVVMCCRPPRAGRGSTESVCICMSQPHLHFKVFCH